MEDRFCVGQYDELSQVLKTLADPSRIAILRILSKGEQNVTSVHRASQLAQPTVSRHLMQMRILRIVSARRDGKQVLYSLGPACSATADTLTMELVGGYEISLKLFPSRKQVAAA